MLTVFLVNVFQAPTDVKDYLEHLNEEQTNEELRKKSVKLRGTQ
jgi:hypothetical protein